MEASAVTARTVQGMARVRSGQAPAWPLVLTGVSAEVSRVKRDFACTLAGAFPPVLVDPRGQSRLGLEGRTRTLSGPSPELTFPESALARVGSAAVVSRFLIVGAWQVGSLCEDVAVTAAAVLPSGSPSLEVCVAALRPPAAWLTSDPAGPLTVRDRDCPQRLAVNLFFLLIYRLIPRPRLPSLCEHVALGLRSAGCCAARCWIRVLRMRSGARAGFGSPGAIQRGCHETVRGRPG